MTRGVRVAGATVSREDAVVSQGHGSRPRMIKYHEMAPSTNSNCDSAVCRIVGRRRQRGIDATTVSWATRLNTSATCCAEAGTGTAGGGAAKICS